VVCDKRDFSLDAATWDEEPRRVQLAKELYGAIAQAVDLHPSMHALDVGCGTGLLTLQLATRVGHVVAADSAQGMLSALEAKLKSHAVVNVTTQHLDLERGETLEGSYDLLISTMTLHHVPEIPPLLGHFYRILRPGGRLCIADLDPEGGDFHGNKDGVFHFGFDRDRFRKLLASAGFVNIAARTAATVVKPATDGCMRRYSVFLFSGERSMA
jgi:ubiquinone/menaquinone biosynthesis C-methylase UbiE